MALVSNRVSGDVHAIDVATRTVTSRVKVGGEPGGMAFSRDGTRAFVANTGDGTIAVLDVLAMKVLATHPAGKGPDGLALMSPAGR
jgi:YVTN family beta-propeller protein